MSRRPATTLKALADDPEVSPYAFLEEGGMRGAEARVLVDLRRDWLATIEGWLADENDDWTKRRLADEVKRLRRLLGLVRLVLPTLAHAGTVHVIEVYFVRPPGQGSKA